MGCQIFEKQAAGERSGELYARLARDFKVHGRGGIDYKSPQSPNVADTVDGRNPAPVDR